MANLEVFHIDLESGHVEEEDGEGSVCFSDDSQFYSTADGNDDGSYDDYNYQCGSEILEDEGFDSGRVSSASGSDCSVDLESGVVIKKVKLVVVERDCRICHLSLVSNSPGSSNVGVAIELGCSCKDDLAAAHRQCAETWFKIKGNKTCEICNSIARNVVGPNDIEALQQVNDNNAIATSSTAAVTSASETTRSCLNGHRFLNFLLACMVFAFVISWLFHFNIPS